MNKFHGTPDWAIGRGRGGVRSVVPANGLLDLRAYDGKIVHVNTTGVVTQIIPPPNGECLVVFDAICTLTHNTTTLILPGAANITTAANDMMQVVDEDNRAARVAFYSRADGQPIAGGMTKLAALTPTVSATLSFLTSFSTLYDNYKVLLRGIKPSAVDNLALRVGVAGVADTAGNYYVNAVSSGLSYNVATTSGRIALATSNAGRGLNVNLEIQGVNTAADIKTMFAVSIGNDAAGLSFRNDNYGIAYPAASILSGVSFIWEGGANFAANGRALLFGYNN